jgi:acyl dehydratase
VTPEQSVMTRKINRVALCNREFPVVEQRITDRDCMLYAISIGLGRNPVDPIALRYVYERDLQAFPTMALVLGHPGNWMSDPETGITRSKIVHGSQRLVVHAPLPVGGSVRGFNRVVDVLDKGKERGAVLIMERTLRDAHSGALLAVAESEIFCRADGGFGGSSSPAPQFHDVPKEPAHHIVEAATANEAALLYRLNGDRNPLHADPELALSVGFERPILHGLCTFGITAAAVQLNIAAPATEQLHSVEARFSRPVYPGETLRVEMWKLGTIVHFRASTTRAGVVLDRGRAVLEARTSAA